MDLGVDFGSTYTTISQYREATEQLQDISLFEGTPFIPTVVSEGKGKLQFRLKKDDGSDVWAAYNPYFHTSTSGMNDQFASAWKRPICAPA